MTDEERVAVAEQVHLLMMLGSYTPEMIESVDLDFQIRQPKPATPPPTQLDDEVFDDVFEDYSDGWKHVD